MRNSYLPRRDADLWAWSVRFDGRVAAEPGHYGVSDPLRAALHAATTAYGTAMRRIEDPDTRTSVAVSQKNAARDRLQRQIRLCVSVIQGDPALTDAQRIDLGLNVPKARSPIAAPDEAPTIDLGMAAARRLAVRLHTQTRLRPAKPQGVAGASLFIHVGDGPPVDPADWTFFKNSPRAVTEIDLDPALPPGTQVWVTARWFNPRQQPGPPAAPRSARIQFDTAPAIHPTVGAKNSWQ